MTILLSVNVTLFGFERLFSSYSADPGLHKASCGNNLETKMPQNSGGSGLGTQRFVLTKEQ